MKRLDIRNIAIIAHVDHGKTTLVDKLLIQSGTFRSNQQVEERMMDSNDLERERGITILAKTTSIKYNEYTINILDTPGHADFGGEVERIMSMVDGVLLIVDAFEGCMPQTRFVLKKALEAKVTPIVVVNKVDRDNARPQEVINEVYDLFIDLDATEDQLEFPIVYASGLQGIAGMEPDKLEGNLRPLYETIIEHIPAPEANSEEPLQMQVTMLDYNDFLGRIGIGRIYRGVLNVNDTVALVKRDGSVKRMRVQKLFGFSGLQRVEQKTAKAGDIVAIAGLEDINVGETVCHTDHPDPLPLLKIDEPTLQMTFLVNNSPFAGREGKHVTSRKLRDRLMAELETDVSLRVDETDSPDAFIVSGRGELHLSILVENMRREGFELGVSKPEVIVREIDGQKMEPAERLIIDVPEEYTGSVMETLGQRKAEMVNMINNGFGQVRLEFIIPSRGLIGYRTEFLTITRGYGIMNHSFDSYRPLVPGSVGGRHAGVLISNETGTATTYGLMSVEDRGIMFIQPGTEVYEGMIVGEHNRDNDLTVNVCKEKHATNVRSATKDDTVKMKTPRLLTLEEALEYLNDDELCEVTPQSVRLRKKYLTKSERERYEKQKRYASQS
ncbi:MULTISPECIES: translational GTPase TypA [Brevibacillus]|jgi:GTP-binding protein|uniref:Large ribosomal subunit assembly factor BipA n=1 Tax=Brevibacillus borstelensis AK1 TaxID=1300222 RepID=M8DLP7_9BACL|nr:translational GTPase TypA [Brevibacillus borstelensis]EMT54543.1 GTP-binding protein TypA [Brevibacillus borstelensis AK1]KKX54354.1 GTP-binding protein TypA [Brevibacillus borstelensis cifa_chp40]MBE5395940.1 translational GTPase TypA [Brevibacillus borstelensis]MCC0563238.1 translational GTPase TypA [Brevibacillus borstelensis]MCM3471289.1 translational GTPase TypA [Brevibacillus borstelensis]